MLNSQDHFVYQSSPQAKYGNISIFFRSRLTILKILAILWGDLASTNPPQSTGSLPSKALERLVVYHMGMIRPVESAKDVIGAWGTIFGTLKTSKTSETYDILSNIPEFIAFPMQKRK